MTEGTRGFRLLTLPSRLALWPLLLLRPSDPSPAPTRWHRRIVLVLAIVLPLLFALAIAARKAAPLNRHLPEVLVR